VCAIGEDQDTIFTAYFVYNLEETTTRDQDFQLFHNNGILHFMVYLIHKFVSPNMSSNNIRELFVRPTASLLSAVLKEKQLPTLSCLTRMPEKHGKHC
jgi:hypothetical protein